MALPKVIQTAHRTQVLAPLQFVPVQMDHPAVIALRPMLLRVLAKYGLNGSSSRRDIAFALRDFVARTMIHPVMALHPVGSTNNLTALPVGGATWAAYNSAVNVTGRVDAENAYWGTFGSDGFRRIEVLYGPLNRSTGVLADTGMFAEYAPGQWRIRDYNTYKSTQCTHQDYVLAVFSAAFGIPCTVLSTRGHDGNTSYIVDDNDALGTDLGWTWNDPTYNEYYLLDGLGLPLSPLALHYNSVGGTMSRLKPQKTPGPAHDPTPYITNIPGQDNAYFSGNTGHPDGMNVIGTLLGMGSWIDLPTTAQRNRLVQVNTPGLALASAVPFGNEANYTRVPSHVAFPSFGAIIADMQRSAAGVSLKLESNWVGPGVHTFQKRVNGGAWTALGTNGDSLPAGTGRVEYRPVDTQGFVGMRAIVEV